MMRMAGQARLASGALAGAGVLILGASLQTWRVCHTTPCGGPLEAFSSYSGTDLGFGLVTAAAGVALLVVGAMALLRGVGRRTGPAGGLMALIAMMSAASALAWMRFIAPGESEGWRSPAAVAVVVLGLVALAASGKLNAVRR